MVQFESVTNAVNNTNEGQTTMSNTTKTASKTARFSTRDADRADRLTVYMRKTVATQMLRIGAETVKYTGGIEAVAPVSSELAEALAAALESAETVAMIAFDDANLPAKKVQSVKGRSIVEAITGRKTAEQTAAIVATEAAELEAAEITYAPEISQADCSACAKHKAAGRKFNCRTHAR